MTQQDGEPLVQRKIIVIGDGACGKTSFLSVLALGNFPTTYVPTVFETFVVDCRVDGRCIRLALWDTAGRVNYERLRPLAYNKANVVCISFSLDSHTSLENVKQKWAEEAYAQCPGAPIILVGLKKDLRDDPIIQKDIGNISMSMTTLEQGLGMKEIIGARKYLECSSLTGDGVDDVLEAVTRAALLPQGEKGSGSCCIIL